VLDVDSDFEELLDGFKYGNRATVYQAGDCGEIILFDGYVAAAGSDYSSSLSSINFGCNVVLQSAAAMYSNHSEHVGAMYISKLGADSGQFTDLRAALVPVTTDSEMRESGTLPSGGNFNPAKFAACYIDRLDLVTKTSLGSLSDSEKAYDKLSSFIDLDNSPDLNVSVNTVSNGRESNLVRVSSDDIVKQLQNSPGLVVFNNYIDQFGLVLAPRVGVRTRSNVPALAVIPNIGVNSEVGFSLKPSVILGYSLQRPKRRLGEYQAVAVIKNPLNVADPGKQKASDTILWVGGYDEKGNPKLLAGIKYTPIPNGKNYKIVSSLGPVTLLALPSWMRRASAKVGDSAAITQYYEKAANAVAKTHYGRGMVATAALTVNIVYSYLSDYYNKIGEVAEIDLSSVKNGYGTQMDKLYGRLIGVNYQITADSVNFNAQCSLTFDCVCNREEHRVFGVSSDDMLCAPKKK
jgi:hypothetical protein